MDKKDLKKCLTEEEVLVLKEKCGIEFSTPTVTSDDLIVYVPGEIPVDGDDAKFVLGFDNDFNYVVSYDRPEDMYTCMTVTGDSLVDVLYNTILQTSDL